ncbi:LURP-one-related/scramblase family protein [Nonomuraea sp. NPDC050663]|uniref:LURP-one-related/scramblase family protein n=1 Tax=Nonomuraea sp. NPDC050663 TaxID=3364370 RepID=UPI0037894548
MGLFRNKHDEAPPATAMFQMQQKMVSFGDDFWIENGLGQKVYKVDGKVLHVRKTFVLEDAQGNELLKIAGRVLRLRDTMVIERGDETVATLHKHLIGFRDRFDIDLGERGEMFARGNFLDHEYKIWRDDVELAEVSKRWMRVRDTYGISIVQDADIPLILAVCVCIDAMSHETR